MAATSIESLPTRKQKREMKCALVKKSAIDLKVLSLLVKNQIVSNLNRTLVVTIHRSRMRKENFHISK